MLKKYLSAVVVCIAFQVAGQPNTFHQDSLSILKITMELLDAVGKGDKSVWQQYLHKDYRMMTEDSELKQKKEVIEDLRPLPAGYVGSIRVVNPDIVSVGNAYILNFVADEHLDLYGQHIHTSYAETDTYIKVENTFQVLSSHVHEVEANPPACQLTKAQLALLCGTYRLQNLEVNISAGENKLIVQRAGRDSVDWYPETSTVFFVPGRRGRKIFAYDNKGNIDRLIERRSGQDLVWTKISR